MHFLPPALEEYAEVHTEPEPPLLAELARATRLKLLYARMLSGHWQGRLLSLVSKLVRPRRILEIGTFSGYSALCLAEGLVEGGELLTLERDPELLAFAAPYFRRSGLPIRALQGDAFALIATLEPFFDLVFIDADKENLLAYYEAVLPLVPAGGLLLTDNILWSGQVVDNSSTDPVTEAIRSFNIFISQDQRVDRVLLPVRDGLFLLRKR